jgi:hypothetical protein
MPGVRCHAETQDGRLLRVLLVWVGSLPTDSNRSCDRRISDELLPVVSDPANSAPQSDWIRSPGAAVMWWCAPLGVALAASSVANHAPRVVAGVWVITLGWMGIGCWLNARRCRRLHCYFSAPILLLGSVAAGLIGFDAVNLGPHAFNNAISLVLVMALLSIVPEMIWGKYGRR